MPGRRSSTALRLSAKGLYTNPSALDPSPGGFVVCSNIVVDRPGMVQSRRGFRKSVNSTGSTDIKRLFGYENYVFAVVNGTTVMRTVEGGFAAWTAIAGDVTALSAYLKQSTAIAKKNLYITTAAGVQRLSTATGILELAGQLRAPGFDRTNSVLVDGTATGINWLASQFDTAYRYLIFKKDGYGDLLLGPVSGRFIFSNVATTTGYAAATRAPKVRVYLPKEIQNSSAAAAYYYSTYFIQLYRSPLQVATGTTPSDEMQQVYEVAIASADVTAGYKDITDYTPDGYQQANLYTNAGNAQSIAGNNDRPPIANDIAVWRDRLWFGGITGYYGFTLQLIAVLGNNGVQNGDTLKLDGITYTGTTGAVGANQYFLESASASAAVNIERTALNLCEAINKSASNTTLYATYSAKPGDALAVGRIDLERRTPGGSTFNPQVGNASARDCWQPVLPTLAAPNTQIAATVDAFPNGLRWSKPNQPDAAPLARLARLGAAEKKILRLVPMRSRLWVFKEDGVFVVTGSSEADFDFHLWDPTIVVAGRDTVVLLENEIFLLSTQGVISISESGRKLRSDPIENIFQDAIAQVDLGLGPPYTGSPGLDSIQRDAFAVGYESDHKYILGMAASSFALSSNPCTVFYVFQVRTKTWTQWTLPVTNAGVMCAYVDSADHLNLGENGDGPYLYTERKARDTTDLQEFDASGIVKTFTFNVEVGLDPGAQKQFGEVIALFLSPEPTSAVNITCSSELATGSADAVTSKGTLQRRTWPQIEVSRCARMRVTIAHSVAQENFDFAGLRVKWRNYDGKASR